MICEKISQSSKEYSNSMGVLNDVKGGKSRYVFNNPLSKIYNIVDFERDVFNNDDTKCDFGVKTDSNFYYVELKGSDVKKGVEQLLETINKTESCFKDLELKARLIVTKFAKPDLVKKSKEYRDLVKKLKHIEQRNDNLIIKISFAETI